MPPPPPGTWMDLKNHLLTQLVSMLAPEVVTSLPPDTLRGELRLVAERLIDMENPLLNRMEREFTVEQVVADAVGLGALEAIGWDDHVQEVCVEGPDRILVRRDVSFEPAAVPFRSLEQLYLICARLLGEEGKPAEPAPNSVVEREVPANFLMTARFPATREEPPLLHFRRLRPTNVPVTIPPPRLPRRELQIFVRFVKACLAAGITDLPGAEETRLRPIAEQAVTEHLAPEEQNSAERERIVALLLQEARQP